MTAFSLEVFVNGTRTARDNRLGQPMHSAIGPIAEAQAVFLEPLRVAAALESPGPVLVVHDLGLGIAANALALIEMWRGIGARGRSLRLVSFESDLDGPRWALAHAAELPHLKDHSGILTQLLERGVHEEPGLHWELQVGAYESALDHETQADFHFLDFYSPAAQPSSWSHEVFEKIRRQSAASARLATYSVATSVRAALLLQGFWVGTGPATELKRATTLASLDPAAIENPLERSWLDHWGRSSRPLPEGCPWTFEAARERLRAHAIFA